MTENKILTIYESSDDHPLINPEWVRERAGSDLPSMVHKDEFSRIGRFLFWMNNNHISWISVKLSEYRDHLLQQELAPSSVGTVLSTIRQSYRRALADNDVLQQLRHVARTRLMAQDEVFSLADVKALTDVLIETMENNISPLNSSVSSEINVVDRADTEHTWLTQRQVETLLGMTDERTLRGLRDLVVLSLMVGMGLRESEVCNLRKEDVRHIFGGEPALRIAVGKGRKTRLIPYGAQDWIIPLVSRWMLTTGIFEKEGTFIIRGMHSTGKYVRQNKLSTRSVQRIVAGYRPDGLIIAPHDLRRTYARLMYMSGVDLERISQNMGHSSIETTRGYVGTLSVSDRSPGLLFDSPL